MVARKISEMPLLSEQDLASSTAYIPIVDPNAPTLTDRNKRILVSSLVGGAISQASVVADATNLVASVTGTTVSVQWTPPAGATSFTVDRREVVGTLTPTNPFSNAAVISGSNTTITGLTASQRYEIRVRASFPNGQTSAGVSITVTLPEAVVSLIAPASFRVTDSTTTTLTVAWNPVTGAAGYRVWVRPTSGAYNILPNATPSGTTYTFVGLSSTTAYTLKVAAVSGASEGPSSEISFTTPAGALGEPGSLTVASFTDSTATLSWTAGDGATAYLIDYRLTGGTYSIPVEVTALGYTVLNLTPGAEYQFRVRSKSGATISTGVTVTQRLLGASADGGGGTGVVPTQLITGTFSGNTSFSVTKPASSSGETYYIFVAYKDGDLYTLTTPTGYTLVADVNGTGNTGRCVLYEKVSAGESAGTVSITVSGTVNVAWAMLRTKGARRAFATTDAAFNNPFVAPSVTATTVNAPVFNFVAAAQWPRTFTGPSNVTVLGQSYNLSGPSLCVGFFTVEATASGTQSYTATDPDTNVATGDDYITISLVLDGAPVASVLSGTVNGSSVTANIPAANAGDSLYLALNYQDSSAYTIATPSGWTLVDQSDSAVGGAGNTRGKLIVFRKDLASSVAQSTQAVTFSGVVTGAYTASRHRGAFRAVAKTSGASSTSFVTPSVTATTTGSTWISWVGPGHFLRTHTPPAGFTELADQSGGGAAGPSMALGTKTVNAGATGTATWTADSSDDYNAISVVIDGTGGDTGGGGTGGGGGGNTTTSFYVGSHVHGYNTADRYASGTYPGTNGPAGDNTMYPAKFGPYRTWDSETGLGRLAYWTGRTGGINAAGDGLNQYDWTNTDIWLDKIVGRGHSPLLLTFGATPSWSARNQDPSSYGNGATSLPTNLTAWAQACRDLVLHCRARYGTSVVKWVEIGNEWIGNDTGSSEVGQFLNARGWPAGSSTPLATLYADAVAAVVPMIRSIDATITVVGGAHTYTDSYWTNMLLNARTQTGVRLLSFLDAFSVHLYGFSVRNPYKNLASKTAELRQWLTAAGYGSLPLIDTEWGFYYPWGGAAELAWYSGLTTQQQADYVYEAISEYKRLGYKAVFWYSVDASPAPGNLSFFFEPERNATMRAALNQAYDTFNTP